MPKSKLTTQKFYSFRYNTSLKIRDINYGNHLSNDAAVGLIHEARIHMFQRLGCTELDLGDKKTGIIIGDLVVNYKRPGYLGDEIVIYLEIDEIQKKGFRIFYKCMRGLDLMILAETGIVAYDYKADSIVTIPEGFVTTLEGFRKDRN